MVKNQKLYFYSKLLILLFLIYSEICG